MIVPGSQNFTGYIGSTFDTIITVYPAADAAFTWVGPWTTGVNYPVGTVTIGSDNAAYNALKANLSINPIGDISGSWSTPLTPMDLTGWTGIITIASVATDELIAHQYLATPVIIQGVSGTIGIKFEPEQTYTGAPSTPLIPPGNYHHWVTMTDSAGDVYYYLNGAFVWLSP